MPLRSRNPSSIKLPLWLDASALSCFPDYKLESLAWLECARRQVGERVQTCIKIDMGGIAFGDPPAPASLAWLAWLA